MTVKEIEPVSYSPSLTGSFCFCRITDLLENQVHFGMLPILLGLWWDFYMIFFG